MLFLALKQVLVIHQKIGLIWLHCVAGGLILQLHFSNHEILHEMSLSNEVQPIGTYNLGWSPIFQLLSLSFCGSTRLQTITISVRSVPGDPSVFRIRILKPTIFGKMSRNSIFTKVQNSQKGLQLAKKYTRYETKNIP